jgi:ComF family protein
MRDDLPAMGPSTSRFKRAFARAGAAAADIIVPPCCLSCRVRTVAHGSLCPSCWAGVHFIRPPLCDVMGLPLPFEVGERTVSAAALATPPAYDRARVVAHFSGETRTLVHKFKYGDRQDLRILLGRWLHDAGRDLLPGTDLIVPVPLSRWRLLWRQFNQAAVLAREVSRETGIAMEPLLLKRSRATKSQVGMTRDQRRRNVAGAFQVARSARRRLEGKAVLLVDDVITTGATVEACARVL